MHGVQPEQNGEPQHGGLDEHGEHGPFQRLRRMQLCEHRKPFCGQLYEHERFLSYGDVHDMLRRLHGISRISVVMEPQQYETL